MRWLDKRSGVSDHTAWSASRPSFLLRARILRHLNDVFYTVPPIRRTAQWFEPKL